MLFTVFFRDGPCKGTQRRIEMGAHPDPTVTCGGQTYAFIASEGFTTPGGGFSGQLIYALAAEVIKGERDLFKAWSYLHGALNRTTRQQVGRVRTASGRIRRAVR